MNIKTKKLELENKFEEMKKKGGELELALGQIKEEILRLQGEYRLLLELEKSETKEVKK